MSRWRLRESAVMNKVNWTDMERFGDKVEAVRVIVFVYTFLFGLFVFIITYLVRTSSPSGD